VAPFNSLAKITIKNPKIFVKFKGSTWKYLIHSKQITIKNPKTFATFKSATWRQLISYKEFKTKNPKIFATFGSAMRHHLNNCPNLPQT
jgi:hypothetical protein